MSASGAPKIDSPPPPPPSGGLIEALDVSSNNGLNIENLLDQYRPKHLIVKCYQSIELGGGGAKFSITQVRAAQKRGCSTSGYVWLYAGIDGAKQVADALKTASQAQLPLGPTNPFWIDVELYTDGSSPSVETVRQAVAECERRGVTCGIYGAAWHWKPHMGNTTEFSHLPLWAAIYDGDPHLVAPGFGGWVECAAKQYSGSPVDRSVFKTEFATPHGG